jgi:hypothetical protein
MENGQININQINQNQDIYSMIKIMNEKYNLLEKKQQDDEELIQTNKKNILLLNENLNILRKDYKEFKRLFLKEIKELSVKINKQNKINRYDENIGKKLNNIKLEFDEKNKIVEKRFKELNDVKNEIQVNKNTKDKELKIDEKKEISIIEKFENLLSIIIYKGDIDNTNYEKLEEIVKELNYEQISSIDLVNQYFANIYKYLPNENYLEKNYTENLCQLNIIIYETIEEIEKELKQTDKNQNDKKVKSDSTF